MLEDPIHWTSGEKQTVDRKRISGWGTDQTQETRRSWAGTERKTEDDGVCARAPPRHQWEQRRASPLPELEGRSPRQASDNLRLHSTEDTPGHEGPPARWGLWPQLWLCGCGCCGLCLRGCRDCGSSGTAGSSWQAQVCRVPSPPGGEAFSVYFKHQWG